MEKNIKKSIEVLKKGGVIIYPTDTIWGIGCDATNVQAVQKIYEFKKRSKDKSLIVLLDDASKISNYVDNLNPIVFDIMSNWNKPLTIVYPNAKNLAKNLIKDDGSVAIRITKDEFSRRLIETYGKPLVSTSANISGTPAPLCFQKISKEIINKVDYSVDLYHDSMNEIKASTIIKIKDDFSFEVFYWQTQFLMNIAVMELSKF